MAARRSRTVISIIGLVLTSLAGICVVISMCTPNWIESIQTRKTGFGKLGIWEACFNNYVNDKDALGKRYNGCHALYSFEYRSIYDWLSPGWLRAIQALMTLTLTFMVGAVVSVILYFIRCCARHQAWVPVLLSLVLNFTSGTLAGISVITFGIMADNDRQWLPHPDSNYLSFSFGFAVLASFLALFAGMCMIVEFLGLRQERIDRERRSNVLMTNRPVSRY